ncbi:MAG: hypothetical protein ACTSYB_09160, partial [Candidatus Helarchaeota archaeon]
HKTDPDIKDDPEIITNTERIKKAISELSSGFEVDFSKTTIFDRWTLYLAFSYALKKLLAKDKQQEVQQILREFAQNNDLEAILLLDDKNFLLNDYLPTQEVQNLLQDLALICTFIYKTAVENKLSTNRVKIDLNQETILLHPITINEKPFFLMALTPNAQKEIAPQLDQLVSKLSKIPIEYFNPK